jgi:predicted component of type VI protein secretion system
MAPGADPYAPPVGGASRATLTSSAGVYTVMPGFEMRVGRDQAQCQIAMSEPRISGVHATLKMEAGQLHVRDEGSNNGTFVNGNRIAGGVWTLVPAGSVLRVGPIDFAVQLE